jgi:hypothetical protein
VYVAGDAQATRAAPSSAHANVALAWSAEKVNVALVSLVVADGPDRIVVSGAPTTVQV